MCCKYDGWHYPEQYIYTWWWYFVYKGAILNMYGGKISNNKALNSKTNSGSYDEIAAGGGVSPWRYI